MQTKYEYILNWNKVLYKLLFVPRFSIISDTKIKHNISLLETYYHKQIEIIQGIKLSHKTRHLKNIKRELPNRHLIIFLSLFFKFDMNQTNHLLTQAHQQKISDYSISDCIYKFMIEENKNEKYENCLFFLYDVLYDYGISNKSIDEFIIIDKYSSYSKEYLYYILKQFTIYICNNNLNNHFLCKEVIISNTMAVFNTFIKDNYNHLFTDKKTLTLRNVLRCNLSIDNNNNYLQKNINRHIINITDFRNISIVKIREKLILIGFYIGMNIDEINSMMHNVYLSGLNNTNINDRPIIDLINSIRKLNPTLLPYKGIQTDYKVNKQIKKIIINAESLGDILTECSKLFYDYPILGDINHIFYTK